MLTRYQSRMTEALSGRHVPVVATHTILGSLGGALRVATLVGGDTGAALAQAARAAFMSGNGLAAAGGAVVALAGACVVLTALAPRTSRQRQQRQLRRRTGARTAP